METILIIDAVILIAALLFVTLTETAPSPPRTKEQIENDEMMLGGAAHSLSQMTNFMGSGHWGM